MSATILLAVDTARYEPGHHVTAAAEIEIGEADYGHVARAILAAAEHHDARILVLGSRTEKDLPAVPFGSVAARLLHRSNRPVLIVPVDSDRPQRVPAESSAVIQRAVAAADPAGRCAP
jgi:nucleotide-binding universal stress UspA family protein